VGEVPLPFHVRNVFLLSQHKKLSLAWFALGLRAWDRSPGPKKKRQLRQIERNSCQDAHTGFSPNVFVKFTRYEKGRNKNITYNARFYLFCPAFAHMCLFFFLTRPEREPPKRKGKKKSKYNIENSKRKENRESFKCRSLLYP